MFAGECGIQGNNHYKKNKKYIESTGGQLKKWYAHISDIKYGKKQRNRT